MFAELNNRATSRAWSSVASSSGLQEAPEQLVDEQMDMANRQAFQQTAERASMTVAKAVSQISKRMGQPQPPKFSSDASKTKLEIKTILSELHWKTPKTKPLYASGEPVPFDKWSKQNLLDELRVWRKSILANDE